MSQRSYERLLEFEEQKGRWINAVERYEEDIRDIAEQELGCLEDKWVVVGDVFDEDGVFGGCTKMMLYDPERDELDVVDAECKDFSREYGIKRVYSHGFDSLPEQMLEDVAERLERFGFEKILGTERGVKTFIPSDGTGGARVNVKGERVEVKTRFDYTGDVPDLKTVDGLKFEGLILNRNRGRSEI